MFFRSLAKTNRKMDIGALQMFQIDVQIDRFGHPFVQSFSLHNLYVKEICLSGRQELR